MRWVTWTCDLDLALRRLFVYGRTCWAFEVCLQKGVDESAMSAAARFGNLAGRR